jgi:Ser-tRNA(Ala) deacylase AlaX
MEPTFKLFHEDPYLKKFEAEVVEISGSKVVLDRTAFHPEGGGQSGDTGDVGGTSVEATRIRDEVIYHFMEVPPSFRKGETIECNLNWDRRYRIMKLHSAAHIMEYFLWQRLGVLRRLGSFVDEVKDRTDYEYTGRLPPNDIRLAEEATNMFLAEGHKITINIDPYQPGIRIWSCGPITMLCGGTHVQNTKEIGAIRMKRKNPGKGKERIETYLAIE